MKVFITHMASLSRPDRYATLQKRASWLSLTMPHMDISNEIVELKDKLPKGYFIINSISKIVKNVKEKGLSLKQYEKAVEVLPNVNMSLEANHMPAKANPHHMGTNTFVNDLISSNGVLDALKDLQISQVISDIKLMLEPKGPIDSFINCVDCVKSVVELTYQTEPALDVEPVITKKLQPIFEEGEGFHALGQLLDTLGIPQSGFIKKDIASAVSPDTKNALILMRTGIENTLSEYDKHVKILSTALSDQDVKLDNLKTNIKEIKSLLPLLKQLEETIVKWDRTHIDVTKALTSPS